QDLVKIWGYLPDKTHLAGGTGLPETKLFLHLPSGLSVILGKVCADWDRLGQIGTVNYASLGS
ncbi:MAG TPA: hypothetical protein V6C65_19195, partial [Allocoleopsis sp.]